MTESGHQNQTCTDTTTFSSYGILCTVFHSLPGKWVHQQTPAALISLWPSFSATFLATVFPKLRGLAACGQPWLCLVNPMSVLVGGPVPSGWIPSGVMAGQLCGPCVGSCGPSVPIAKWKHLRAKRKQKPILKRFLKPVTLCQLEELSTWASFPLGKSLGVCWSSDKGKEHWLMPDSTWFVPWLDGGSPSEIWPPCNAYLFLPSSAKSYFL